jgi:hypothetical protein
MELGKQPYTSVMEMPVKRLSNYLKWKIKFDEEVAKAKEDQLNDM